MKSPLNAVSLAAGLSLAAMVLGGSAAAAQAQDVHIRIADLDLNTPQGRAQFDVRVRAAAERTCPGLQELSRHANCVRAFRAAADEDLSDQRARLARGRGASFAAARR